MAPLLDENKYRRITVSATYILSIILTAATTAILYIFKPAINPSIVALLFLIPVGLSTALWGLWPGVTAALTAFLAFNYFFIQPYYTLRVRHTQDLLVLLVFLVIAVVISQLVGSTRQSLAKATARERDAIRLYEFSNLLAGLHGEQEIIETIADQISETFQADRVEIFVEGSSGQRPTVLSRDGVIDTPHVIQANQPGLIIPLQTAQRLIGEIRIWRTVPAIQPDEELLLRTYSNQGILAIERARLLQAETRAKVSEESDRLKTSLLSSVSHELRTPLATIKASVSSLRSGTIDWDSAARQELLEAVDEETDHLNQLVENLLNMSRIESGVLKPNREWNDLDDILASVLKRFHQPGQRLTHQIEVDLPDDLPLIPVDYLQLEQVFTNLLSNSMKYSPEGSLIRIWAAVNAPSSLRVQVSNQGPPVPEEHLERIFDKFYRITAAERVTGTGLGLSICKGIIEAHGGRIWAENLPDGFAFDFLLPLTWQGEQPRLPDETSHSDDV